MSDDDIRARADERRRLMAELELERNQLIRNVETCRLRDITAPFVGEWTVLDIMAHVAEADAVAAAALRSYRDTGSTQALQFACDVTPAASAQDVSMIWPGIERLRQGREALLAVAQTLSDDEITAEGSFSYGVMTACRDHDKLHWHDIAARLAGMAGARRNGAPAEND